MEYTVISLWDFTGQVLTDQITCSGPHLAMKLAAKFRESQCGPEVQVIGVIEGKVDIVPPCEDSGLAAYVEDLTGEEGE